MSIVAYSGHPTGHIFSRTTFSTWEQARISVWNDGCLWDLHDTDIERTWADEQWETFGHDEKKGQLDLFGTTT